MQRQKLLDLFFKTLERLTYWEIMDTALKDRPISKRQHAFRVGMSTESAISQTVNHIEKGFHKGKISLVFFIDISLIVLFVVHWLCTALSIDIDDIE